MWFRALILPLALLSILLLFPASSRDIEAQSDPALVGRWSSLPDLPFFPVHLHLLPTGKVMMWTGDIGGSGNDVRLWDPDTGLTTMLAAPGYDMFCSGHVFLGDGRLFVASGHIAVEVGLPYASTYDPFNNLWTSAPDMSDGRWYPTATVLGSGDVLVVSGAIDTTIGENTLPEVFQVQSNTWRSLTSAHMYLDLYPRMHLAPDGRVFNSAPNLLSRALDTSGTGSWSAIASHAVDVYRYSGASVAYDAGKIIVLGGGDPPTKTAEVIDLNVATPSWRQVASMTFPRQQVLGTILPDGKVLAMGGTSGPGFNNPTTPVFAAEMWNPATETWSVMASAGIPRLYHSTAALLPDGRVMTAGGNNTNQIEIFEPPYLFAGPRPTISSAPGTVAHGQTFFVATPEAASITRVSLIGLTSVTHGTDMNQRFNRLSFSSVTGGLNVTVPSANLAPPGPYMLFILNGAGVPSVSRMVRVGPSSGGAGPALVSLSPSGAQVGGPGFTLTINGSGFVAGSEVRWNGTARTTTFVNATQLTASIPSADIAAAGTPQVTVVNPGGGTSNALTFEISAFTASPATVAAGGSVTGTWSGLPIATANDWIGLYAANAPNSDYLGWMYVSCSQVPAAPRPAGSCSFPVPLTLAIGGYELRLFANNSGSNVLLTSNIFTVNSGVTVNVSPAVTQPGGGVTVSWSGISGATANDWIGLYRSTTEFTEFLHWIYVSCVQSPSTPRPSGSCPFTIPATVTPGNYVLRLFSDNSGTSLLGTSNSMSVGVSGGTLHFSAPTYAVGENGGNAAVTIARTGGSNGAVSVTFATSNGSATAPSDYTAVSSQTVNWANGETASKTVSVPITDDTAFEGGETVNLSLSNPAGGATLGGLSTAVLTINDNDPTPAGSLQFSAATHTVAENGGSATITVTRTGGSVGAVGVTISTSNGSATTPADYTAVTQTVNWANGDAASKMVTIPIADDTTPEGSETVNLGLSSPTGGATAGSPGTAVLTITDNDPLPASLQFSAATYTVAENGGTATIAITRTGGSAGAVGVTFATSNGSATTPADYTAVTQTVNWANGDTANKTVSVPIINNAVAEPSETVNLTLSNPTGAAALGNPGSAVLTITDDDLPTGPSLVVSPTTIARGNPVTASWTGIATPTATDWMALYVPGTPVEAYIDWIYVSCSKTPGAPAASGSCPFPVPSSAAAGTYELRIFSNGTWTRLATSNSFMVTAPGGPTLNVTPTTIARGNPVTATWSGISAPTSADWIALYVPGTPVEAYIDWIYVSCSKTPGAPAASGSCPFLVPSSVAAGTYELRIFSNGTWTRLATSNSFTVTAPGGPTLNVTPTTIVRGNPVTATWSGISAPTSADWIALYVPGTPVEAYIDWIYVSCSKTPGAPAASGSCPFLVPSSVAAGTYELRIFSNGTWTRLATSNSFTAQ